MTEPTSKPNSSLLGILPELRVMIFKDVFAEPECRSVPLSLNDTDEIGPMHPLLHVNRQLRDEAAPVFVASKPIRLVTLGELGAALLLTPENSKWLTEIHISYVRGITRENEFIATPLGANDTRAERGLNMLVKIPNLRRLRVDVGWSAVMVSKCSDVEDLDWTTTAIETALCKAVPEHPRLETVEVVANACLWGVERMGVGSCEGRHIGHLKEK